MLSNGNSDYKQKNLGFSKTWAEPMIQHACSSCHSSPSTTISIHQSPPRTLTSLLPHS